MEKLKRNNGTDQICGMKDIIDIQKKYNLSIRDKMQLQMMRMQNPNISYKELENYAKTHKNSNPKTYQTLAEIKKNKLEVHTKEQQKKEYEKFANLLKSSIDDDEYDR